MNKLTNRKEVFRELEGVQRTLSPSKDLFTIVLIQFDQISKRVNLVEEEQFQNIKTFFLNELEGFFEDQSKVYAADILLREMALFFPNLAVEQVFIMLESFRNKIQKKPIGVFVGRKKRNVKMNFYAGIASFPVHSKNLTTLFRKAEQSLYTARKSGRGFVQISAGEKMALKSTYYTHNQVEKLQAIATKLGKSESCILRENLDLFIQEHQFSCQ